jgi:hypothetical protein
VKVKVKVKSESGKTERAGHGAGHVKVGKGEVEMGGWVGLV